jgi:hypothetical protein
MSTTFWQTRLTAVEAEILAIEAAILALTTGGVVSYTLDTGQTRQLVTKLDLPGLDKMLDSALNRYATIQARCTGSGVVNVRPCF